MHFIFLVVPFFVVVDDSCEFWLQSILWLFSFYHLFSLSFFSSFFLSALTTNNLSLQNRILYGGLEMLEREKKDVEVVSCDRQTARQTDSQTDRMSSCKSEDWFKIAREKMKAE